MIDTASKKVQINQIVKSQLPSFVQEENPLFIDFLRQYYLAQEYQGGPIDIITNLNEYQKVETFSGNEALTGFTTCVGDVTSFTDTINVTSTIGWPSKYGLLKIDNEIITYTGITTNSFTGCIRGFSGVESLHKSSQPESLVFTQSEADSHISSSRVTNLSNLFLQEFWKKTKNQFLPGFEERTLDNVVDKANFLRQAKDFYASKGTDEAVKILFSVLFNKKSEVVKPIDYLIAPSDADYIVTNDMVAELISGDPEKIIGQTLYQTDEDGVSASIFNVQRTERNNREYYTLSLSKGSVIGEFKITGSSSLIENVAIGATVLTVDSTVGFAETGSIYVGTGQTVGIATYGGKSSTQFFGVTGITSAYTNGQFIRGNKTVYSYEDGDITKPVYFRLTSVVSDAPISDVGFLVGGDQIGVKALGNVSQATNHRLNSWIHNIKTKTKVAKRLDTNTSIIDATNNVTTASPHLLYLDDSVTLIDESSAIASNVEGTVNQIISPTEFKISISSGTIDINKTYSVRKNLTFASSNGGNLGVSNFVANVQNSYSNTNDDKFYVTSGSLPGYTIYATNRQKTFGSGDVSGTNVSINNHGFYSGDLIRYSPVSIGTSAIVGLTTGSTYAVTRIDENTISLSESLYDASVKRFISLEGAGTTHVIVPRDLDGKNVQYQNFIREFPVTPETKEYEPIFENENIGMFRNGVEIFSNRSGDVIYYGSIEDIEVENGGSGYDVVNPPNIHVYDSVGSGATAFAVVENGSFNRIDITYAGYDIKQVPSITITGGNGTGATAEARLRRINNNQAFNSDIDVNTTDDKIEFDTNHLFFNGETVVYNKATNYASVGGLIDGAVYYVHKVSDTIVQLMTTYNDAVAGTNPVDLTQKSAGTGRLVSVVERNVLDSVIVTNSGSGYSNRKTLVNATQYPSLTFDEEIRSGINTADDYIFFKNHGFSSGDLVEYSTTNTAISGLSTTLTYYVLSVDKDRFRVANAGVGTTATQLNYQKNNYVDLQSVGAGTHTFKYPDINVSIDVISGIANTSLSTPTLRAVCTGSISDVHVTSVGSGYGVTDTFNVQRRPNVTVSNGSDAQIDVIVQDGSIVQTKIKDGGAGYATPPVLTVNGDGKYARLVATLTNGSITGITIVDAGRGYLPRSTTVTVSPVGSGAKFKANIKKWEVDFIQKYKRSISENDDGVIIPSQNSDYGNKFAHGYLPRKLRRILNDNVESNFSEKTTVSHSPIVGWAYDGCPIYGPYGYSSPTGGIVRRLTPGYSLKSKSNRPPTTIYPLGFFVTDWSYTNTGDLDQYNGRFCKTPEYPNGVYAYFCTINPSDSAEIPFVSNREPLFPYVLNGFKFKKNEFNEKPTSIQSLPILNSGDLIRNTYPYKFGFENSEYDYLVTNNIEYTELTVRAIKKAGVSTISSISGGEGYKVGDRVIFNNSNSGGNSATAKVKTITGIGISQINLGITTISGVSFVYDNQVVTGIASTAHNLRNGDIVDISGIGTGELKFIEGPRTIAVSSVTARLDVGIGTSGATGITTTLVLETSGSSNSILVDDILVGGATSERLTVLSIDKTNNKYRVRRQAGVLTSHDAGTLFTVDQSRFIFTVGVKTDLSIEPNRKIVFNPQNSIGIGTTVVVQSVAGVGTTTVIRVKANDGTILTDHSLPPSGSTADNSISIVGHDLSSGQELTYGVGPIGIALTVSNNLNLSNPFNLVDGQTVYAVNKGRDLIGITTTKTGIGTTATSLYFTPVQNNTGVEHSFTTKNTEYTGTVKRYDVTVLTGNDHNLTTNDKVTVTVLPNSTLSKSVEYDTTSRRTIIDPIYFGTSAIGVGTPQSIITVNNHGFISGDKVLYVASSPASPLINRGEYYVKTIDENRFRLSTNYSDSVKFNDQYVGITTFGSGVHKLAKINPIISATRGQTIGFAVSDSSLGDLKLEFFEDQDFINRYEGLGISTEITRSGSPGNSGAIVNLKLSDNVPSTLYYKLTPLNLDTISVDKRATTPDNGVVNGSKIVIDNSVYSGTYGITTTSTSEFRYALSKKPESNSYTNSGVTTFRYVTTSPTALGGINEVEVTFPGVDYLRPPGISTVQTARGTNAFLRLDDDNPDRNLGRPAFAEITKIGFDYPSDKSVKPKIDIPTYVTFTKNYKVSSIGVVTTGRNYLDAPVLVVVDRPDISLRANLEGTSVTSVDVLSQASGFDNIQSSCRVVSTRNTNGVGIVSASSNGDTNFLTITQPVNGWKADGSDFPFAVGDRVFVEGVGLTTALLSTGGYNSSDYNYSLFTVLTRNPISAQITYSIAGIGTTGGTYDSANSSGRVIKQSDLPTFSVNFEPDSFFDGERVTYSSSGFAFVSDNGYDPVTNTVRLRTENPTVSVGDVVKGSVSGAEGTVAKVQSFDKFFNTGYSAERPKGWQKDTGKLNDDFQKLEDNDYYQNFSYSIKSEVQETEWSNAVDSIIHPSGYKKFSDLVVTSVSSAGFSRSDNLRVSAGAADTSLFVNVDNLKSFYNRDDFDLAGEETITNGLSKFITFSSRKITTFINAVTNKVDVIDDISGSFTGIGTTTSATLVGLTSFRLTVENGTIVPFTKIFDGSSSSVISVGSSIIRVDNHNFQTGEKIKYDPGNGVYGNNRIGIETTNNVVGGVSTNFLPDQLFVSKIDNNRFSLAGLATAITNQQPIVFRSVGTGTSHSFDVPNPDERVIIDLDGIIQSPLYKKNISVGLGTTVGTGSTTITVVGITSISAGNLLQIDSEILRVSTVGFGSTNVLAVERGLLGTVSAAHTVGAAVTMRGGDFHIVKDVIFFTDPPYGPIGVSTLQPGISTSSTFSGRIFNRQNPTTNFVFDDVSDKFTGVGQTFTLLQDGQNTTGIVTTIDGDGGSGEVINYGIILVNNIFQRPTIDYNMDEAQDPGIGASIFFTGTVRENLPKGGIVNDVTVGFGSGYQSLVAAAATAIINGAGAIESVVVTGGGSGYRSSDSVSIQVLNPLGIGSTAVLSATVGAAGSITGISTVSGGTGYASTTPPIIIVGIPTAYNNVTFTGGQGSGLKATIIVGTGGTIIDFDITERGIGYANGDVLTVTGIPTTVGAAFSAFTFTVDSIITDEFSGFSFGQLLPLYDFSGEFNSFKRVFTLRTTAGAIVNIDSNDTSIDIGNNLLIFLNDVLQKPGENYIFGGGTEIEFTEAPREGSKLQILFFRGSNKDVNNGTPLPTVKIGDKLQLRRQGNFVDQNQRTVLNITGTSKVETNIYGGLGINTNPAFLRSLSWEKQTSDNIIDGQEYSKARESLIAKVQPTTRIIQNVGISSNEIFVENAFPLFSAYDNRSDRNTVPGTGIKIVRENNVDGADGTVTVSAGGSVSSVTIVDGGLGYETVPTVSFATTYVKTKEIGRTWTQSVSSTDIEYQGIAYTSGTFIAVGSTSGINTSTDGTTWYDATPVGFGTFFDVVGMSTNIVAVGLGGTIAISTGNFTFNEAVIYSRVLNGFLYSYNDTTITQDLNAVVSGQTKGVAVGAAGTILFTEIGSSGFGTAFVITPKYSTQNLRGVGYNENIFIAVGDNGEILRSNNAETWVGVTTNAITTRLNDVVYGDNKWIAVGAAGSIIRSTDNGINWSVVSSGSTFNLNSVYYQDDVWVAVGQSGMVLNSIDTNTWYKKFVGVGTDFNALVYGDNKLMAVGLTSSIYYSVPETVSAAATATVSAAGTISAVTISDGGFGYDPNQNVDVLFSIEPVTSEVVTSVDCEGDFGVVVGVATSATGINTTTPMAIFKFDADAFLNQAGFGNIVRSGIQTGYYFVINNSIVGNGLTSITIENSVIGIGTSFIDNVYRADRVDNDGVSGIVTVYSNVRSLAGLGTTSISPRIGYYSWGRFYNFTRSITDPKSFTIVNQNGYTGLTTAPLVVRIQGLNENYSNFTETT
jgi:hypothetical protein